MIGKNQIQISGTQIVQGIATSDYLNDGGMGTESYNLSLIAQPGVIRAMPTSTPTQSGSAISSGIVASCESPELGNNTHANVWFVDNGGSRAFSATSTAYVDQSSSMSAISAPNSEMVVWGGDSTNGFIYISRDTDISELKIVNTTGAWTSTNNAFWTSTLSGSQLGTGLPHPLLVFEGSLWIGDGPNLWSALNRTTQGTNITLDSNERVQALAIDPNTGLMMIGVRTVAGNDDIYTNRSAIYLYNGFSPRPTRKILVDGRINAFRTVGGQVFVAMDNCIGAWNGAGVVFMRRLLNVYKSTGVLPYKIRMTSFQNTLLVADGANVLAYGDIGNGKKVWWPFYRHTNTIDALFFAGYINDPNVIPLSPLIAVNDGTNLKYIRPFDTTTVATGVFYTNNINFQRPVRITDIRVFTTGITTTAGIGNVQIIDENEATYTPAVSTFTVLSANSPRYVFDFHFDKALQTAQPLFTINTQAFGIIRVVIYYDTIE